mmetsp:Transcript_3628/g.7535  ORF Transcript_3628/g.7535 Transcript_3628/m.7535 type:complete len:136 (+) Transcript_3628:44-451(+)
MRSLLWGYFITVLCLAVSAGAVASHGGNTPEILGCQDPEKDQVVQRIVCLFQSHPAMAPFLPHHVSRFTEWQHLHHVGSLGALQVMQSVVHDLDQDLPVWHLRLVEEFEAETGVKWWPIVRQAVNDTVDSRIMLR